MSAAFVRRFLSDPGNGILLNIESVNILDLLPPASISGIGTGTVHIVGEFEDGPYNSPLQLADANDLTNNFGNLGFTYGGVGVNYPCALQRFADGTVIPEYWNGNGLMQLNGKQFGNLIVTRVDTHIGNVTLTPLAYITGAALYSYLLAPNQVLSLDVGAGSQSTTFTATAATVTSGSQTYSAIVAGDTLILGADAQANFTVTFQSTDTTQAAVISRVNAAAGFPFLAVVSGTTTSLTGIQQGNQAQVRVVGGTATAGGKLNFTVATTFGTGNVANILQVTPQEIIAAVQTAVSNTLVQVDQNGALRISKTTGVATDYVLVTSATTATGLGFKAGQIGTVMGVAGLVSSAGTYTTATAGTFVMSYDLVAPFTVTITTGLSLAQTVSAINAAAGATIAVADSTTQIALTGIAPGGNINIISASAAAVITQLGLSVGLTVGVPLPNASIPAGTVVQTANAGTVFVTAQSVQFGAAANQSFGNTVGGQTPPTGASIGGVPVASKGPWLVPIRHAVDNTLGVLTGAGLINSVPTPPLYFSLSCINLQPTTAALSDAAIDAQYTTALQATTNINSIAKITNIIYSARQSNTVRQQMRANAISASANGCYGRVACIRPPLGTTEASVLGNASPGVAATSDQRTIYNYPGASTFVPAIALRGSAGGVGFTASGNVDVGSDGFMASILSQLPPEENPGQETSFTGGIVGVESSPNAQNFQMSDYILFKAAGVAALRMDTDTGVAIFQSGVTSVNPQIYPQLTRISRRRMADFIQDSLGLLCLPFSKKLSTAARRAALVGEIKSFLEGLLNSKQPDSARIAGYSIDITTGNNPISLGLGMFRITINVQTLSSLDSIVLATTIGETVTIQEQLPQAA